MGEEISEINEAIEAIKAPKKRDWGLWLQVVPGVVGMFIGVLALYAALSEAEAVRKQQQAAVWPFLELTADRSSKPGEQDFQFVVANKGIGPARVLYFDLRVHGVPQADWPSAFATMFGDEERSVFISNKGLNGNVLIPGERVRVLYLSEQDALGFAKASKSTQIEQFRADQIASIDKVIEMAFSDRLTMHICYCSVFDDCWLTDSSKPEREQVDACPVHALETNL